MLKETRKRSLGRTLTWRVIASCITAVLAGLGAWWTGSSVTLAVSAGSLAGLVDVPVKLVVKYIHERIWASRPWGLVREPGCAIMLVGLPCSGKTTIAKEAIRQLGKRTDLNMTRLDGDTLRDKDGLCENLAFSPEDRQENLRRVRILARHLVEAGGVVFAANIMPYEVDRVRWKGLQRSLIVHIATDAKVCEARDVKDMWRKARSGLIPNFTGVDAPFEPVDCADLIIPTDCSVQESAGLLLQEIKARKWI